MKHGGWWRIVILGFTRSQSSHEVESHFIWGSDEQSPRDSSSCQNPINILSASTSQPHCEQVVKVAESSSPDGGVAHLGEGGLMWSPACLLWFKHGLLLT